MLYKIPRLCPPGHGRLILNRNTTERLVVYKTRKDVKDMQEEKTVWIDAENRILAFQPTENTKRISKAESLFWAYIMELIHSGYRIM